MAITNLWELALFTYQDDVMGSASTIGSLTQSSLNLNPTVNREVTAGNVYAEKATMRNIQPIARFTSAALKSVLDIVSVSGACLEAASNPGIFMYIANRQCTGPASGSSHTRYQVRRAVVMPRTLSVQQGGDGTIVVETIAIFDGTNNPVTVATNQALPAIGAQTDRWKIGKLTIGGASTTQVTGIDIDFGVTFRAYGADGEDFDSKALITAALPSITIRGLNPSWLTTIIGGANPLSGKAVTHANTTIYLRKRDVADITAEHISITTAGLLYMDTIFDGNAGEAATSALRIDGVFDGTNAPLVINTATAIP